MYQLKLNGHAPAAIINNSAEPIIATGAIIADIPMVDGVDVALLRSGDEVAVDADEGNVELPEVVEKHVVTSIVRSKGRILLLRRSNKVGSYRGQWAGVSGYIEPHEQDKEAARRELLEEVSIGNPRFVRKISPIRFRDKGTVWCVHPFLVEVKNPKIKTDWEHQAFEWVTPEEVARYQTVPGLHDVICKLLGL
jgi:8-oxo-dGTP pyrophosphatase MutT (NUDIX family)